MNFVISRQSQNLDDKCYLNFLNTTILFVFFIGWNGCASLSGFQDGRTVPAGTASITTSLSYSQSPDFERWREDTLGNRPRPISIPSAEFSFQYGIMDKFDIRFRFNTMLNVGLSTKYQFLGDHQSPIAVAAGLEIGTFGFISGLWNIQVPVYYSVHPVNWVTWYVSPRYIYQSSNWTGALAGLHYFGGNTGIFLGRKNQIGVEIGYFNMRSYGQHLSLVQFGIGGKFPIEKQLQKRRKHY